MTIAGSAADDTVFFGGYDHLTIEGTPPGLDNAWKQQYGQSRYERLLDSIDEYLCDDGEDCGAAPLLRDIKRAITYAREWPEKQLANMDKVLAAINDIDQ